MPYLFLIRTRQVVSYLFLIGTRRVVSESEATLLIKTVQLTGKLILILHQTVKLAWTIQ